MLRYLSVAALLPALGVVTVDIGNKDATYWNNICGDSYKGKIITGYHVGLSSGIVSIGNSAYTLQIANGYMSGEIKIRTYYSDGSYWTPWKTISFS